MPDHPAASRSDHAEPSPAGDPGPEAMRQRLVDRLDAVRRGQVAVISAPPGFGKRDLVTAWVHRNADIFEVNITQRLTAVDLRQAIDARAADAASDGIVALVVEDQEVASDAESMARLVEAATASRVRLVVACRVRPDIALGTLAARNRLVDIDAAELAYTTTEIEQLLIDNGYDATADDAAQIMAFSDGWPVIVDMMIRMHLSLEQPERIQRLMDSYIADRITTFLTADDVKLLLTLSTVRTLDPQTASMLSGRPDAAAQLSRLQALGVPISWDAGNHISINPSLAAYFRRQLLLQEPERAKQLIEQAAVWLRNRDRVGEAVQLAVDAREFDMGWMVIGDFIVTHLHQKMLMEQLPDLLALMPSGWQAELMVGIASGRTSPETLLAHLHGVEAGNMLNLPYSGRSSYALFFIALLRRAGFPRYPQFDELIAMAESIDSAEVTDLQRSQYGALQGEYGLWLLHMDRLEDAKQRLLDGVGVARLTKTPWVIVLCLGALALINAAQGNRTAALRLIEEGEVAFAQGRFDGTELNEYAMLARTILDLDVEAGTGGIAQLAALVESPGRLAELDGVRTALQSIVLTGDGKPAAGLRLVNAYRDEPRPDSMPSTRLIMNAAALLAHAALNEPARAREELDQALQLPLKSLSPWRQVFQAHIALTEDNPQAAIDVLRPWIGDSRGADARITLSMLGAYATAAAMTGDFGAAAEATERARVLAQRLGITRHASAYVPVNKVGRHEVDLTEAERKVLAHLNSSDTLGQTAESMFISTNTLKTHLRRIYRKLGVSGREEAIERARALGITHVT